MRMTVSILVRSQTTMLEHPAWLLIILGALLLVIGLVWLASPLLSWLGHLPGDIRIENDGTRIYIPITTSIVLSILLSALLSLLQWFWKQ